MSRTRLPGLTEADNVLLRNVGAAVFKVQTQASPVAATQLIIAMFETLIDIYPEAFASSFDVLDVLKEAAGGPRPQVNPDH